MATVQSIISDIVTLTPIDQADLKRWFIHSFAQNPGTIQRYVEKERFSGGLVCPVCGKTHIIRHGHREDGTQRYKCKDCGKTFVSTTNTVVAYTKKDYDTWEKYIDCMMYGLSLSKTAKKCGISERTAFNWRHKLLGALQNMALSVTLNGIVEADETFFALSYKGNHKNSKTFTMPRNPHKRGNATHIRGLSKEKVCVPCAVNRSGLSIAKASNLARVATKDLHTVYDGRIQEGSTIVTDLMNSYVRFAKANGLDLIQLKGGKSKKGIYNIQHINSYHNELKLFMSNHKGVSTKHIDNYLIWHNFINYAPESEIDKRDILLRFSLTQNLTILVKDISKKPALPFAA